MLPKKHRLKKDSFQGLQGAGRSFFAGPLSVRVIKTKDEGPVKVAVVVSKKVAKTAVKRNTLRRKIYNAIYPLTQGVGLGKTLLFYPKIEVLTLPLSRIEDMCKNLIQQSKTIL